MYGLRQLVTGEPQRSKHVVTVPHSSHAQLEIDLGGAVPTAYRGDGALLPKQRDLFDLERLLESSEPSRSLCANDQPYLKDLGCIQSSSGQHESHKRTLAECRGGGRSALRSTLPVFPDYSSHSPASNGHHNSRKAADTAKRQSPEAKTRPEHSSLTIERAPKSSLEIPVPADVLPTIKDLDASILRLQAERARLLDFAGTAQRTAATGPANRPSSPGSGPRCSVSVCIVSVGLRSLDEPLFDEAHSLVRRVGNLRSEFRTAVAAFGTEGIDISVSLRLALSRRGFENQTFVLCKDTNGVFSVQLRFIDGTRPLDPDVQALLCVTNKALRAARCIALFSTYIARRLEVVQEEATKKVRNCERVCRELGVGEPESWYIKSVLQGNCTTIASAAKTWVETTGEANRTVEVIKDCLNLTLEPLYQ